MTKPWSLRHVLVLLAILALALVLGIKFTESRPAPALDAQTISGQPIQTANWKGRPYLVNFWATSCVTCVQEMPQLVAIHQRFAPRGYQTVAVAMSYDQLPFIETFTTSRGLPFLVVYDQDGRWAQAYGGVNATPTSFLVNAQGEVVKRYVGAPDFEQLAQLIERDLSNGGKGSPGPRVIQP